MGTNHSVAKTNNNYKNTELFEKKLKHKWKNNTCIVCGCYRIKEVHPNNKQWTLWKYYDPDTGEESRKIYCKTNQLLFNI